MQRYLAKSQVAEGNLSRIADADFEGRMARMTEEQGLLGDEINMGNEDLTRDIAKEGVFAGGLATFKGLTKGAQKITTEVGKRVNNVADVVERMGGDASTLRQAGTAIERGGNVLNATAEGRVGELGDMIDATRNAAMQRIAPADVARGVNLDLPATRDLVALPERPAAQAPVADRQPAQEPIEEEQPPVAQELDAATGQPIRERETMPDSGS